MSADEIGTRERFNDQLDMVVRPAIDRCRGRLVKTIGDGFLVEFGSVVDAVRCATEIQAEVASRQSREREDRRMLMRIGVHLGDVIVEGEDIHGDGVNIASRLEALAEPGGICVSDMVHSGVGNKLSLRFDDLGLQPLKNIAEPLRAFAVIPPAANVASIETGSMEAVLRLPSIAVLPFENMSGDPEQEYFSDGITEDLITALSRIRQFRVIARNSTFTFKGESVDVRTIAHELAARYVIEGSVRKIGKRVRVTAQLIDGATGDHIYSEGFDRDLEDVFAVQDELTRTIASKIKPELSRSEFQRVRSRREETLDVWELYQRAQWHAFRGTKDDFEHARKCYERAIAKSPDFGPALSGLAANLIYGALFGYRPHRNEDFETALRLARQAVDLDSTDANAWSVLGLAYSFKRLPEDALFHLQKSLELDPTDARTYYTLGATLIQSGRAEDAKEQFFMAMQLSPRDPRMHAFMARLAESYLCTGDFENAVLWGRKASRQPGGGWTKHQGLVAALAHLGRIEEARSELEQIVHSNPEITQSFIRQRFPIQVPEYLDRLLDGLVKAGLPQ